MSNLQDYRDRTVSALVTLPRRKLSDAEKERHRIASLLLMAITHHYWCGLKRGSSLEYPLNPPIHKDGESRYLGGEYRGHNIAALATDATGRFIDFEFNHNSLFNSSVEHAESRLIRRLFSLARRYGADLGATDDKYGNSLSDITVYTTLESCSQCAGIMALGQVQEVVYLQDDPGQHQIGAILYNLTRGTDQPAPRPIHGGIIELPHYRRLNERYETFQRQQESHSGKPFCRSTDNVKHYSSSVTSFLCTRSAHDVYVDASQLYAHMDAASLAFGDFCPGATALSNEQVLLESRKFFAHATTCGRRGTPHRT